MDQKVVLITGGSRGIGAAIVEKFAQNHNHIILNYKENTIQAQMLKQKLESLYPISVLLIKADISDHNEVKKMMETILNQYSHIDILINNAAIACDQIIEEKTEQEFRNILDVNLVGTFLMSKEVGFIMKEQGYGHIINIASTNGIDTYYPESMDYDASKAGVISLTKNLATLYAPIIQVNAVAPGWVETDMNKDMDSSFKEKEEQKILLGRFAQPEEIATVVYFLTTKEASYINGSIIRVDGGKRV